MQREYVQMPANLGKHEMKCEDKAVYILKRRT